MSRGRTLALVAARPDAGGLEFLRICVGLLAGGHEVTLLILGPLRDADAHEASAEAERLLGVLMDEGCVSGSLRGGVPDAEVRAALRACDRIVRAADEARNGEPSLLVVDDAWLAAVPPERLLLDLMHAGQVVRA